MKEIFDSILGLCKESGRYFTSPYDVASFAHFQGLISFSEWMELNKWIETEFHICNRNN